MGSLNVAEAVEESYRFFFDRLSFFKRLALPWLLVVTVVQFVGYQIAFSDIDRLIRFIARVASDCVTYAVAAWIAVAWCRAILLNLEAGIPSPPDRRDWLAAWIMMLFVGLPTFCMLLFWPMPAAPPDTDAGPMELGPGRELMLIGMLVGVTFLSMQIMRVMLIVPALAVDSEQATIEGTLEATASIWGRLSLGLIIVMLPPLVLAILMLQPLVQAQIDGSTLAAVASTVLAMVLDFVRTVLGFGYLAVVFRQVSPSRGDGPSRIQFSDPTDPFA